MASKYKNYLGYDKRDYHPEKTDVYSSVYEEDTLDMYMEEKIEWDEVSMEAFEFLRDKVEEMSIPILDQHFGLHQIIQLLSTHVKKNKNTI